MAFISSSRALIIAAAVLMAAAILLAARMAGREVGKHDEAARPSRGHAATPVAAKSPRHSDRWPSARGLQREIAGLSLREVQARLPEGEMRLAWSGKRGSEEVALLFRRFGTLRGEEALEEIYRRYASHKPTAAAAMVHAILGWMEVDPDGALAAFRETLAAPPGADDVLPAMRWKGEVLLSGFA